MRNLRREIAELRVEIMRLDSGKILRAYCEAIAAPAGGEARQRFEQMRCGTSRLDEMYRALEAVPSLPSDEDPDDESE